MVSESLPSSASVMQATPSESPTSIYCSPALEDAWRRFGDYDKNANLAQDRFLRQRMWITALGVIVTALAVFDLLLEQSLRIPDHWLNTLLSGFLTALGLDFAVVIGGLDSFLNLVIIIIPILISILVAGAVKFNMGVNWVMLRSASESIKREIFRYRTQVEIYHPDHTNDRGVSESRDVTLARKIKQISKRVMETQVNMSELEIYDYKKEGLPPVYGVAPGDDGFSELTPEQYVHWRIEDQFDYYRTKAKRLARELQRFQWMVYLFGGLGTLLAATQLQIWVAVTSAVVAALSSFLEFKRLETNLIACNLAASDLYDIRTWWRALPDSAKQIPGNKETLIKSTEAVIQGENASWLTEMREALSEIYSDKDAEGEGRGTTDIAVLPENFTRGSESAASASSAFDSIIRGEGGSKLVTMKEAIATSMPALEPDLFDEDDDYYQEASGDDELNRLDITESYLNGSAGGTIEAVEEDLVAAPPSPEEIAAELPSVGIDPNQLTTLEAAALQGQPDDEEEIDLSETGGVFIEDDVLTPDPYVRPVGVDDEGEVINGFEEAAFEEAAPDTERVTSAAADVDLLEDMDLSDMGGVFIEIDEDLSPEPYVRPEGDLPQDYEDDLKALDTH